MTKDKKIHMATAENPRGQGHTIVGGRPAGKSDQGRAIPRALEIVMKKASLEEPFRELLIAERDAAVRDLGLKLDPAEEAMLIGMPAEQLRLMIQHTIVPEPQRSFFKSGTTAALLALLAQLTFGGGPATAQDGATTQAPPAGDEIDFPMPPGGARPDLPDKLGVETGIRPDLPDVYVPVSKGIRPDIPPTIRPTPANPPVPGPLTGIRPDNPEESSPIDPTILSLENIYKERIGTRAQGLTVSQTLDALRSETGLTIRVQGQSHVDPDHRLEEEIAGLTLGKALRKICQEAVGSNGLYQIGIDGQDIDITFQRGPEGNYIAPPPKSPHPPQDRMTRGSRPDFPSGKD